MKALMNEPFIIIQLRSSIFFQQNIGYTPESAEKFEKLLMPGCKAYGIPQPGLPILGMNANLPQYGMPWRLFKKFDGGEYNIAFQPGKIDIFLVKEVAYGDDTEKDFCNKSVEWFSKILETQGDVVATRIAYAPLYAIKNDGDDINPIWGHLLKKMVFDGIPTQDVSLSFLLKSYIGIQNQNIQLNMLHNIYDGNKIEVVDGMQKACNVLLLELDLNTVPVVNLSFDKGGIAEFLEKILEVKCNLVNNVTE